MSSAQFKSWLCWSLCARMYSLGVAVSSDRIRACRAVIVRWHLVAQYNCTDTTTLAMNVLIDKAITAATLAYVSHFVSNSTRMQMHPDFTKPPMTFKLRFCHGTRLAQVTYFTRK